MPSMDREQLLQTRLQTMRIITGAILAGAFGFLAAVFVLRAQGQMPPPAGPSIVTYVCLAAAVTMLFAHAFVPSMIVIQARQRLIQDLAGKTETEALEAWLGLYQTALIMRLAFVEGAAFTCLIAYLLEGSVIALGVAVGCMATLAMQFPTRPGVETWIENQQLH